MSLRRRTALVATLGAAASWWPALAGAQAGWPNRPIKLIDAYAPGGSTDTIARMIGSKLSARLGQPVIVENRSGAGGGLGTDAAAKSPPDGYTLLLTSTAMPTNTASGKKLPYDLMRDLAPVGMIATTPLIIVVPAESPIRTLKDLVDLARARPADAIRYGSSGVGSMSHIGMELLASVAQVKFLHVPYKGVSLSVTDLLGGQLQAVLGTVATHAQLLESGRLRGLVVSSAQRSPFLPTVPSANEAGFPAFQIDFWFGLMCPAGVPTEVVARLNTELNGILALPDVRDLLARFAAVARPGSPDEFGRVNAYEISRWSKVIKDAGIRME